MRYRGWIYSTVLLVFVAVAQPAAAQRSRVFEREHERGGLRHSDVRGVADEAERLSDSFKGHLDHELDRTIIDGTRKERQFEDSASRLENALDDVRSSVNDGKKYDHTRDRVKRAVKYAQELDRDMRRVPFSPALRSEWRQLLNRLNQLAYFYDLKPAWS